MITNVNQNQGTNNQGGQQQDVSFRGDPIPKIMEPAPITVTSPEELIQKIESNPTIKSTLTLDGVRHDNRGISHVRLTTGDIVTVETAIALADKEILHGYTIGANANEERTLRSIPSNDLSIHELPEI